MKISPEEAKRMYFRDWRRKNPDKVKAAADRYWERRAARLSAEAEEREQMGGDADETVHDDR